jgi:FkbM family methyltransferase
MNTLRIRQVNNEDGIYIILENDAIGKNLLDGQRWEPHFSEIAKKLIGPNDICVDAGANFGYNTIIMSKITSSNVYAFEPLRITFQQLCTNVFLNGLTNVYTYNLALGNEDKSISMNQVDYFSEWVNIGATNIGSGGDETVSKTLDSFNINPQFMKIDIQGYECFMLDGSVNTINKSRPIIFVEIEDHQLIKFGKYPKDLIDIIKSYEYDIYNIKNQYPCDHICFPKHRADEVEKIKQSQLYILEKV